MQIKINPVNKILYDKSKSRNIIYMPTKQAYEMRKKGSIIGSMEPKRNPETMLRIEQGILSGNFEPIVATKQELSEGRLQEGKHRILIAKKLGMKKVPIEIVD